MHPVILGLGTAMPAHSIRQPQAAELAKAFCGGTEEQARLLPNLYQRTRIDSRGSVLLENGNGAELSQSFFQPAATQIDQGPTTEERMNRYCREAAPLALVAATAAISNSGVSKNRITHLVTVSCTGFSAPGVDIFLIKKLELSRTIGRVHVGFMGCHGAVNGLRVADALARSTPKARILLCAVELCSLHFQYGWESQKLVANALFADGAAAAVIGSAEPKTKNPWHLAATGSSLFPDSEDAMSWRIGNHGFQMALSPRVPELIGAHLKPWLTCWLKENRLSLKKIRSWAVHPGGPRILSAVQQSLSLPERTLAVSNQILAQCGNMSSPTLLFILERLRGQKAARPCVALGFGPGLVAEAALFL